MPHAGHLSHFPLPMTVASPLGGGDILSAVETGVRIGEFARLAGLTIKALRHYHRIGLLSPAKVDPWTGHRLYSSAQLREARLIVLLVSAGMPLRAIADVLRAESFDEHLRRLRRTIEQRRQDDFERLRIVDALLLERDYFATLAETRERGRRAVIDLMRRRLQAGLSPTEEARARWEIADAHAGLGEDDEAIAAQLQLLEFVRQHLPAAELPWAWHDATMLGSWVAKGAVEEWLVVALQISDEAPATPENRAERFELLHSAVTAMGGEPRHQPRVDRVMERMREILREDPKWEERDWAMGRLFERDLQRAFHGADPRRIRRATAAYARFIERQTTLVPERLSNLATLLHWNGADSEAITWFERSLARGEPGGYTYIWYAAAIWRTQGDLGHTVALLAKAAAALPDEEFHRVFEQEFSDEAAAGPIRDAVLLA